MKENWLQICLNQYANQSTPEVGHIYLAGTDGNGEGTKKMAMGITINFRLAYTDDVGCFGHESSFEIGLGSKTTISATHLSRSIAQLWPPATRYSLLEPMTLSLRAISFSGTWK